MITKKLILISTLIILMILAPQGFVAASTLFLSPVNVNVHPGDTFTLTAYVNVDSYGRAINAAQGSISFNKNKVTVVSVSKASSIFSLWPTEPTFSNPDGIVRFEGGLPSPGFIGSAGRIVSVVFRVNPDLVSDNTEIVLTNGSVLANDGAGTDTLSGLGKTYLTITQASNKPPVPAIPEEVVETKPSVPSFWSLMISWIVDLFNASVSTLSSWWFVIVLAAFFVGIVILMHKHLEELFAKIFGGGHHKDSTSGSMVPTGPGNNERRVIEEMKDEIKLLNVSSSHRPLSSEEKYLKERLEHYINRLEKD